MTRAGIFGISLSGKTTLAKRISKQYFDQCGRKSLVLDPHEEAYGQHALVYSDEEKFWEIVWNSKDHLVIVDEAAAMIRRERELVPVFTRLRHLGHKLIVIGHNGADLLPVMREQFDTLYLFRQPKKAAELWADLWADDDVYQCASLGKYEYIYCQLYEKCRKFKATKPV